MPHKKLLESIDACRPGYDDVSDPEFALLAEALRDDPVVQGLMQRSQQFDSGARAAFADVPVPEGLADRLLLAVSHSALAASVTTEPTAAPVVVPMRLDQVFETSNSPREVENISSPRTLAAATSAAASPLVPASVATRRGRDLRHWLWKAAIGCASVAAIAAVIVLFRGDGPRERVTRDELSAGISTSIADLGTQWQAMDSLPSSLLPKYGLLVSPHQWQSMRSPYDPHAVVCDLSRKRGRAYFVVLNRGREFDVPANVTRLSATGGWAMWAWQDATHVYVLAVDEKQFRLDDFVRPSRDVALN